MALISFVSPSPFFPCIHGVIKIKLGMGNGTKKGMEAFDSQDLILFLLSSIGFVDGRADVEENGANRTRICIAGRFPKQKFLLFAPRR